MKIRTFPFGPLGGNCYLCTNDLDTDAVVIDPIAPPDVVLKSINKNIKIHFILITHSHFDHMLSYESWRAYNIPVAAMAEEIPAFLSPTINLNAVFCGKPIVYSVPEIPLKDQQILHFANQNVKVIATPGHTLGSCCYLIDGALFSGDTVFAEGNYGRTDFPTGNSEALFTSIRKLCTLDDDVTVYPGHGVKEKMKNIKSVFG